MFPLKDNLRYLTFPWVTVAIVAVNIAFFIAEMSAQRMGMLDSVLQPWLLSRNELFAALTSAHPALIFQMLAGLVVPMFLHQGFMHIFGNTTFFFAFAPAVEARMGSKKFLAFYLAAGVIANIAQTLTVGNAAMVGLGASGAIGGVLGAYLLLFPRAEVEGWVPLSPLPLPFVSSGFFFLLDFILMQMINIVLAARGALSGEEASVGYGAHLGGIGFGMICALILIVSARLRPPTPPPVIVPARPDRPRYLFEIMQDVPVAVIGWVLKTIWKSIRGVWFGIGWMGKQLFRLLKLLGRGVAFVCRKTGLTWLARRVGLIWLSTKLWLVVRFCARHSLNLFKQVRGLRGPFKKAAAVRS